MEPIELEDVLVNVVFVLFALNLLHYHVQPAGDVLDLFENLVLLVVHHCEHFHNQNYLLEVFRGRLQDYY